MDKNQINFEIKLNSIYDQYRDILLNSKYYRRRLRQIKFASSFIDIFLAIGTSGLVVSSYFWQTFIQNKIIIASAISLLIVILAVSRPFLPFLKNIERYLILINSFQREENELKKIISIIRDNCCINDGIQKRWDMVEERLGVLSIHDDLKPSKKLLNKLSKEVNEEYPPEKLWIPSDLN